MSSSADESRSLTAISVGGKEVLRRRRGLVVNVAPEEVEKVTGEGVEGIRTAAEEVEGMGEEGGE